MSERIVPVVMKVLENGRSRTVKVGQAIVSDTEVVLSLETMTLDLSAEVREEPERHVVAPAALPPAPTVEPGVIVAPQLSDLERLAERSRRVLADPKKVRWHDDVRGQLSRIEAEMARLRGRAHLHP